MTHRDDIQGPLVQLGKAHREAAFSSDATRYPWRTAELQANRPTHRRFAWVRVAAPLAAAAAVAVLFVVPSLFTGPVAEPNVDVVAEAVTPEEPQATIKVARGSAAPCDDYKDDGDYNGDGVVAETSVLRQHVFATFCCSDRFPQTLAARGRIGVYRNARPASGFFIARLLTPPPIKTDRSADRFPIVGCPIPPRRPVHPPRG